MGQRKMIGPVTRYVAAALQAKRCALGLTYDDVAQKAGLSKPLVVYAHKGERGITVDAYMALCAALGIDAAQLLDEADQATHPQVTTSDVLDLAADHTTQPLDRDRWEAEHEHEDPA